MQNRLKIRSSRSSVYTAPTISPRCSSVSRSSRASNSGGSSYRTRAWARRSRSRQASTWCRQRLRLGASADVARDFTRSKSNVRRAFEAQPRRRAGGEPAGRGRGEVALCRDPNDAVNRLTQPRGLFGRRLGPRFHAQQYEVGPVRLLAAECLGLRSTPCAGGRSPAVSMISTVAPPPRSRRLAR